MHNQGASIIQLCQCLRGTPPAGADWMSIIALANQTLTTPKLIECLRRFPDRVPPDAARYLEEIFERNLRRNDRLLAQLQEAVTALNAKGVTPVLMKGTAMLATRSRSQAASRLISDLDIVVAPDEADVALTCLLEIGYRIHYQAPRDASKWYADLQRPQDAGTIDLHQALPGSAFFYRSHKDIKQYCALCEGEHGAAYIPSAVYQTFLLIVHDQFQDSDYWVGALDLRHLLDLRDLIHAPEAFDWNLLASLCSGRLARNAVETQLVSLHALLDVQVPIEMRARLMPRLQHWRRVLTSRMPALRHALLALTLFDFRNYRSEIGRAERIARHQKPKTWVLPKMDTVRFLLELSHERRSGKV